MPIPRTHIWTAVLAGVSMAIASAAGLMSDATYARESAFWAAQGVGQDTVNLFLVFPLLLALSYLVAKGSVRALLIWLGLLVYVAYSYVLYSFFVSFGPLFLVYVATLGLSFYSFFGSAISIAKVGGIDLPDGKASKWASAYLFANGAAFAFLWLSEIVSSLRKGTVPPSGADLGFIINPVQVLDLGFILPAMIATAVLLRRKESNGRLFAVPVMTFAIVMSVAIVMMIAVMRARGLTSTWGPGAGMVANAALGIAASACLLRGVKKS